ncbi:hypothetical protein [Thermodesulfobacterium hydrogeniphilum]|uniref:hypothetical protein n=1 Tax=Thermodesulfobacterium hydrogeniphilum TaxID=161156 RepID=UPI000570EF07|nr:hypothetical protein [Thermodesulfobacterium hydrogeniphilum]
MKKLILFILIMCLGCFKAWAGETKLNTYGALYGTYLDYSGSKLKDNGYAVTGYLSIGDGINHNIQIGIASTHINYKNNYSDLDQQDFTFAYSNTNQILKNHSFTLGIHYIESDDDLTDHGCTLFFDGTYLNYKNNEFKWSGGLGIYYSNYDELISFDVLQLTPHATFKIFSDYQKGGLYLDALGYYIYVDRSNKIGIDESNYYSLEGDLRYYYGKYDFKIGGWIGQQVFAVKNNGFVVYNLKEEYKGGIYGEMGYTFENGLRLSFNLGVNNYEENGDSAIQTVGTFSISYKF